MADNDVLPSKAEFLASAGDEWWREQVAAKRHMQAQLSWLRGELRRLVKERSFGNGVNSEWKAVDAIIALERFADTEWGRGWDSVEENVGNG